MYIYRYIDIHIYYILLKLYLFRDAELEQDLIFILSPISHQKLLITEITFCQHFGQNSLGLKGTAYLILQYF